MQARRKRAAVAVLVGAALVGGLFATAVAASGPDQPNLSSVPANAKAAGYAPYHTLSPELQQFTVAQGSMALENPQGIVGWYGYENDAPSPDDPALPQMIPAAGSGTEAQKTEPDKNTYLILKDQKGADPSYDYGTHFLFQGHEASAKDAAGNRQGYVTRVNLDADVKHRVTLMATHDTSGKPIANIDGSTWDPFAQRLLLTTENATAPTYSATATYPSQVEDVSGAIGRGGYEGIQDDSDGNIWIVEDIGGPSKQGTTAKQPNSFVYRYVPAKPGDLHNGKLQVLQVANAGHPVTFESQAALGAPDQVALRTYGASYDTKWVTIHDTATSTTPFNANALAKAAQGTPFKRPENGQFRPGSKFTELYFDETGDTNATSPENGNLATGAGGAGGWTSIFKLVQRDPSADAGKLSLFYEGNESVAGLDNVTFLSNRLVTFAEDAGDTLHTQRKALDSGYVWNVDTDYSNRQNQPVRWLGEGRDPSAAVDAGTGGFGKNDGDNEITGVHVSDGDPGPSGILGAKVPNLSDGDVPAGRGRLREGAAKWRWFWTQQHGDNNTWEVVLAGGKGEDDR